MTDLELARRLKRLRRTVLMLETELRHGQVDEELIQDIDAQLESGLAVDARCEHLRIPVDALRESTLTPRLELHRDTIRACEKLQDSIEAILGEL